MPRAEGVNLLPAFGGLKTITIFHQPDLSNHNSKNVLIIAGEASGDLHGANLVSAMKTLAPDICFQGVGGDRMVSAGVDILTHSSEMAVVGLTEVFSKRNIIIKTYFKLRSILKTERPDLLVLIDYPDFNIILAGAAKKFGVPVLYYVSPQVWASRSGRVKKISRRVDRMAVILPFEKEFYKKKGIDMPVKYVGHPLLDQVPYNLKSEYIRNEFGIGTDDPVIGLLPGSRNEEINNLLPDMIKAAEIISYTYKNLTCILPVAPTISDESISRITEGTELKIITTNKGVYHALKVCDLALVASGTATLETAIMGVPMVIAYRISPFSYRIAKWVVKVQHVGLVNLVAGEEIVPELIQDEVTPQGLADECLDILGNEEKRTEMINRLKMVKESLGTPGASIRTARIALEMIRGY